MTEPVHQGPRVSPRVVSVIVLLVTLLVGALGGIWLDRNHLRRDMERRSAWRGRASVWGPSEREHRRRWTRWAQELELTQEQRAAADTIFAQRARQLDAARAVVEPDMKEIMRVARQQIDSLLTPEQRAEFQQMRGKHKREAKGR